MRGKRISCIRHAPRPRITPADAGKTALGGVSWRYREDHPRGCGENRQDDELREKEIGSPPRMRGKLLSAFGQSSPLRITPADAGKTVFGTDRRTAAEDHPRGCGENCLQELKTKDLTGSPPRMRGKPVRNLAIKQLSRITPADAGKTAALKSTATLAKDHPRGCGENTKKIL